MIRPCHRAKRCNGGASSAPGLVAAGVSKPVAAIAAIAQSRGKRSSQAANEDSSAGLCPSLALPGPFLLRLSGDVGFALRYPLVAETNAAVLSCPLGLLIVVAARMKGATLAEQLTVLVCILCHAWLPLHAATSECPQLGRASSRPMAMIPFR